MADVGTQSLRLFDAARSRPVHVDVWYPRAEGDEPADSWASSLARVHGLDAPGPVAILSHGSMGAASQYSWLAAGLASRGWTVLGVSHFRESYVYGPETISAGAVSAFGDRARDLSFVLDHFESSAEIGPLLRWQAVLGIGHSAGGHSVMLLAGAELRPEGMLPYCSSPAGRSDLSCRYLEVGDVPEPVPAKGYRDGRIRRAILLDAAIGPTLPAASLAAIDLPVLVVYPRDNDFLENSGHALHYAGHLPRAEVVVLDGGEGHFVFLDPCDLDIEVFGVPLCRDRDGVSRPRVHRDLLARITRWLDESGPGG